ncbi:TPA: hypothetical protein HA235_06165 [Candidatus Woesearchaeota archaeon]|nr:hypothetical protein [Candidatus Woesearchaeota archaeon]HIH32265.1 hypothetical protein [Candidatus Woesearchaeota archaeon]HIJ01377.1 hypothetical protein [Candidatus Woesearchaeota archaeon]HIJ14402.1 hypothetical protein [Candidatus Woesearchaeota archaeon]
MDKELLEWTINYIKNKDLTLKKIQAIETVKDIINIKYPDKTTRFQVKPVLDDKALMPQTVVCLNSEENFKFLIKNWAKMSKINGLNILFVNQKNNDKWLINPYVHSMIADPASLETGLRAMFDTANGLVKEVKRDKKKPKIFDDDVANEEDGEE